jgi:hypothetical protein
VPNLFPTAPTDLAGGILIIKYGRGRDHHRLRVHIPPFDAVAGAAPNYDRAYNPSVGPLDNNSVRQTAISLIDAIKPYYNTAWTFKVAALYSIDPTTHEPVQQFPVPYVGSEGGTNTVGDIVDTDAARFIASTYTFSTRLGGRGRISLFAAGARPLAEATTVNDSSGGLDFLFGGAGGLALDHTLVGYLTGLTSVNTYRTAIVGHDGSPFVGDADLIMTPMQRARRKFGFGRVED